MAPTRPPSSRLRYLLPATVVGLAATAYLLAPPRSASPALPSQFRRSTSLALPDGGCTVLPAIDAPPEIQPVFAASYPGSGARMTWNLIEALTGVVTGDDWDTNGKGKGVVTVKTHYPHWQGHELPWKDEIKRSFVVIRDPLKAIPSFHNFVYEFENKLENHSTRAPIDAWIRWRDANFDKELEEWRNHLEYWMNSYPTKESRLVMPYEFLTSDEHGAGMAVALSEFLGRGPGVEPIAKESVPCVWQTVVMYKKGKTPNTRIALPKNVKFVGSYPIWPGSSRSGDKERPYTNEQLAATVRVLRTLKGKYEREDELLGHVLGLYIEEAIRTVPSNRVAVH